MRHVVLRRHGRTGRAFGSAADLALVSRQVRTLVAEDDHARDRALRRLLATTRGFDVVAYPGRDAPDEAHAYLDVGPSARPLLPAPDALFACVVVTPARVRAAVAAGGVVVEDLSLQVAASDRLTPRVVRNALAVWVARLFATAWIPKIRVWAP
jgi:hypothetical protein